MDRIINSIMNIFSDYVFQNGARLKNRFVVAPMTTYSSNEDLSLSKEEEIYFEARGKTFGMVITPATAINKDGQAFPNQLSIKDKSYLSSMQSLANSIKKGGAKAVLQLHHGGRMSPPNLFENQDIVSASPIKAERDYLVKPRQLLKKEVYQIIDDFASATQLAIEAGFDGVELHGANTYLIQQFFSPHSNQRTDEFGGTIAKRMTFPLFLIDKVLEAKKHYGNKEFLVGYRISPEELENPGIRLEDTERLIEEIIKKDIDYIHLSLGEYNQSSIRNLNKPDTIIKRISNIVKGEKPIIGVGQIDSLEKALDAIHLGFDLLAIGMASLADPDFVKHLEEDKKPIKEFSNKSLLPKPLLKNLHRWRNLEDRGYTFKI